MSGVIGTAKASRWLGLSEATVRRLCRDGKLAGAYQPAGLYGKWLIPTGTLEGIWARPQDLTEVTDMTEVTV